MKDEGAVGAQIGLLLILGGSLVGLVWLIANLAPASFGSWFIVVLAWGVWTAIVLFAVQLVVVVIGAFYALTRKH